MNRGVGGDAARRRVRTSRRAWSKVVLPVGVVFFLSGVALSMVWQNVQYTRASLKLEKARRQHEALLSDLNAEHMKVSREITLSQLVPKAKERLGLVDSSTEDMRLVAFAPEIDRSLAPEPGLLDRIVPAARAGGTSNAGDDGTKEAARLDQDRR